MTCPRCNGRVKVMHSEDYEDSVERFRKCLECGYNFKTIEVDFDYFERMVNNHDKKTNS